jgi:SM-20-related protein
MFIDLDAVRNAVWNPTPYPWASLSSPLHADALGELVDQFPLEAFTHDMSSPNHERRQQTRTLAVRAGDRLLHRDRMLPPAWDSLIEEFLAPAYSSAVGAGARLDLSDAGLAVAIWRMPSGGFNATHCTSWSKIMSQLIYFSPVWDDDWGGHFEVRAGEGGQDVVVSLPPHRGTSVLIRATPSSWHAVSPVIRSERRSLSIHYFHPEADLSWFLPKS